MFFFYKGGYFLIDPMLQIVFNGVFLIVLS